MEALEVIITRRSVRKFTTQKIEQEIIDTLLHAAMSAPSADNQQPWHFLIIDQRPLLDGIPTFHPYAKMCLEAPLAIVVCIDTDAQQYRIAWSQDLSAATQNILLAARALGLGAVWLGVYPHQERIVSLRKLLNLKDGVIPFSIIPIGYTDVKQKKIDRYKEERVHFNKW